MFYHIYYFILGQILTCSLKFGESSSLLNRTVAISESLLGGEIRRLNLQTPPGELIPVSHLTPDQLLQLPRTREIITVSEISADFLEDSVDPDFDSGLKARGCGLYDAFFATRKPVTSSPPYYIRQGSTASQRSESFRGEKALSGDKPKKRVKETRGPDGFLHDDEKAMMQFCCCCCLAGWCNKIPYEPKRNERRVQPATRENWPARSP